MDNNFILKSLLDRLVMHYITIKNVIEQEIQRIEQEISDLKIKIDQYKISDQLKKEQEKQEELKKKRLEERYGLMFGGKVIARIKQEDGPYLGPRIYYKSDIYQYQKEELIRNMEILKSSKNTILAYIFLLMDVLQVELKEKHHYIELMNLDKFEFDKIDLKSLFKLLLRIYIFNNKNIFNLSESLINIEKTKCKFDDVIKEFEENKLSYKIALDNPNENSWFCLQDYSSSFLKLDKSRYEYNSKLLEMFNNINAEELKLYIKALAGVIELTPEEIKQVEDALGEKIEHNKTFK